MSHTTQDRTREEGVRRLSTDEDPRGSQHRDDVYRVDLRPRKAKTRDRAEEERLRIKILTEHEPSD
ncbi:MAG TPA: hypothetical protein VFR69_10745 [Rubrobacteraceae bacterium]|nr:hypothetical protein [Rubrobacteraceae bacterium]